MIQIYRKTCEDALQHYGLENQQIKLMEECGELIQAVAKDIVIGSYGSHVEEELADVLIMIGQMIHAYRETNIQEWVDYKLERLRANMEEEKNEQV